MDWIQLLSTHSLMSAIFIFILGATIGSFLNVVIYRYPIMLKQEWEAECMELLNQPSSASTDKFNLTTPRSHCPHCKHAIPFWLNIPLLTYIIKQGKCAFCHTKIAFRYFLVEMLTAFLSVIVFLRYGATPQTSILLILTWGLIALAFIDFENQFLPDPITYTLLWLGLLVSTNHLFISPKSAIFGAIFGYLFLFCIAKGYLLLRKQEGMGLGDCKMLAMIGAYVGITALTNVILLSTLSALLVSVLLLSTKKIEFNKAIPFGPFIAIGGWVTLIFNAQLINWILSWAH